MANIRDSLVIQNGCVNITLNKTGTDLIFNAKGLNQGQTSVSRTNKSFIGV